MTWAPGEMGMWLRLSQNAFGSVETIIWVCNKAVGGPLLPSKRSLYEKWVLYVQEWGHIAHSE